MRLEATNLFGIPTIADQRAFAAEDAGGAEVSQNNSVAAVDEDFGKSVIRNDVVKIDDDGDWKFESIMTAIDVSYFKLWDGVR